MAAVLSCGPRAALSHLSAAAVWTIGVERDGQIEVSIPAHADHRRRGIIVHRRAMLDDSLITRRLGIPVTTPTCTLIDLATRLDRDDLEAAVNAADKLDLVHPDELRRSLDGVGQAPASRYCARCSTARHSPSPTRSSSGGSCRSPVPPASPGRSRGGG
jgi:hypothetical protein